MKPKPHEEKEESALDRLPISLAPVFAALVTTLKFHGATDEDIRTVTRHFAMALTTGIKSPLDRIVFADCKTLQEVIELELGVSNHLKTVIQALGPDADKDG